MSRPPSRLLDILRQASPGHELHPAPGLDAGTTEREPFPFLAIVGQEEMKLALLLSVVNPRVAGVLLIGARGTAKTTAVRALADLLPTVRRSLCSEGMGCTEEMLERDGMAAICDACATRVGYGQPLTVEDRVRMVELPLNARLEDVVGTIDERIALEQHRVRLEPGLLAQADQHILYIDEVNLLDHAVSNAILDAAAQGFYTVRRGSVHLTLQARFTLIGSMNPEEGRLRPQIMDRFGLRAVVRGLSDPELRFRAYQRALLYSQEPEQLAALYAGQTLALAAEIAEARARLPAVTISAEARALGLGLVQKLGIDSSRAEITLFEAARAHAAADGRQLAEPDDIRQVALLALRQRSSRTLQAFFAEQDREDAAIRAFLEET